MEGEPRTDAELLQATPREPEAFGAFYRRHVDAVLAYALSRCGRPEVAADLTAEVFAAALEQHRRFDSDRGPARAWLLVMTNSRWVDSLRRGQVEDRARRRLGMPARELDGDDLERIDALINLERGLDLDRLVADLPAAQRDA
ncbi:MAG: RNA polymerase sigma factor, partial [Solirubrobacteraceae bacterium]